MEMSFSTILLLVFFSILAIGTTFTIIEKKQIELGKMAGMPKLA